MDPNGTGMVQAFRRNPNVEESPLQGELMLFEPDKGRFFVLNRTMAYLWHNCVELKSIDDVIAAVPASFSEASRQQVDVDMRKALDELLSLGLVTSV